eukprot:COSAG06_NODE_6149_length_3084_cov_3.104188_5_plen_103_part_00
MHRSELAAADSCRRDIPAQIGGVAPPSDTDHLPPDRCQRHGAICKEQNEVDLAADNISIGKAHSTLRRRWRWCCKRGRLGRVATPCYAPEKFLNSLKARHHR